MVLVDHIVQFSPLVRDMNASLDAVHDFLGAFPSRRNHLEPTGVDLAIIPFGNETFMELVCPFNPQSAGARVLDRTGEGWFMLNIDLDDRQPVAEIDREIRATGARVVAGAINEAEGSGTWHLHPVDACGVLLALYVRGDRPDHSDWAGPTWKHYVDTNRRVIDRILGTSLATNDLDGVAERYRQFGFVFGDEFEDGGDRVRQASLRGGTFLQLRAPTGETSPLTAWLAARGQGLYHFALGVQSLDALRPSLDHVGAVITRPAAGNPSALWADVKRVFGMPIEFREV